MFLRELMIFFMIDKNGKPENKYIEEENEEDDKKSYDEFPEWKLKVGNSFFSIDFGGEFVANMNTLDLLPQNEKSFISLFSTLHKQKIGLFSESERFYETLSSLSRFTGYFLQFANFEWCKTSSKMISSLTQSTFLGGFWCGFDFSQVDDFKFLSEINMQLLIITYLQYYQNEAKENKNQYQEDFNNISKFSFLQNTSIDKRKKTLEEFLSQFKILPLNDHIIDSGNILKSKFFLNCSKNNLNFFKLSLKNTWRNVTCFKTPSGAYFEHLLYLKGIKHIGKIKSILNRFWKKCKTLSVPLMINFENPKIIWKLVCLLENNKNKKDSSIFKPKNILSIFKKYFISFVPNSHHHQLISILENLFSDYICRKKYSLRPRKRDCLNPFADNIKCFMDSFSSLLKYSSSILITGSCPSFLPALLAKVLDENNSLAFSFSNKTQNKKDFFGSEQQTNNKISDIFMNSTESRTLKTKTVSFMSKNNLNKSINSKINKSIYLNNVNFKSKSKRDNFSPGFYSQLFKCFEYFNLNGGSLLTVMKKFGLFSFRESLNFTQNKLIKDLDCLLNEPKYKFSITNTKEHNQKLKNIISASDLNSQEEIYKEYSSISLILKTIPTLASTLFYSSHFGNFVHSDGSLSNFKKQNLNCIFQNKQPVELPPSFLGKISILHFEYQDSFKFLQSAFKFHIDLIIMDLPKKYSLPFPLPLSLTTFFKALVQLFNMLFERLLLIQKKYFNVSRLSAFSNFLNLLKKSIPMFLSENQELLKTESNLIISRCVLGIFLQTVNFSINVSTDQKPRKNFYRHLKSLLDSFFNFKTSIKYSLPFDRTLLKGMNRFNLDLFYFQNTSWHLLPDFLDLADNSKSYFPEQKLSVSPSLSHSTQPNKNLLLQKSMSRKSSSKISMDINDSFFMLNPEQDYINFISDSSKSFKTLQTLPIPGQLKYLHNFLLHSSSGCLRYHPRFPLPEILTHLLKKPTSDNLGTIKNTKSFFMLKTILEFSSSQNSSESFIRNRLLNSYIPVDPITLKHTRASNLSDLCFTVIIHDVSLNCPSKSDFWNRLVSSGEIQNLSSSPFSICSVHNTQLLCLSPIKVNTSPVSKHFQKLEHSPYITIPNFKNEQLTQIFTMFVDSNNYLCSSNIINPNEQLKLSSFVTEFSDSLAPFLSKLYYSSYLKDIVHYSISNPKIFNIFRTLCEKIKKSRKQNDVFNSGSIISIFQKVFRQSNLIQESAATILYNSSVNLFKSVSSQSSVNILKNSQIAQAINNLSKNLLYKNFLNIYLLEIIQLKL